MTKQTLTWTALPNGVTSGPSGSVLKLSVYVSFRLYGYAGSHPTLNDYPDVLHWRDRIQSDLRLKVAFENGPTISLDDPSAWNGALSPDFWQTIFPSSTKVTPYEPENPLGKDLISYPAKKIEEFFQEKYSEIAVDFPTSFAPTTKVAQIFAPASLFEYQAQQQGPAASGVAFQQQKMKLLQGALSPLSGAPKTQMQTRVERMLKSPSATLKADAASALQSIATDLKANNTILFSGSTTPKDFMAFELFHATSGSMAKANAAANFLFPQQDFHEIVASLGDYPNLLRKLGLVLDLEIPLQGNIPANSFVSVLPGFTSGRFPANTTAFYSPRTSYHLAGTTFRAGTKSGTAEIINGLLNLNDTSKYDVVTLDVDGSAMKLRAFLSTIEQERILSAPAPIFLADAGSFDQGLYFAKETGQFIDPIISLPALRTTGLSLVRLKQAEVVQGVFKATEAKNAKLSGVEANPALWQTSTLPEVDVERLYAEDLVRGYRIDARESSSGAWRSLCKRKTVVSFTSKSGLTFDENREGMVSLALTSDSDGSSSPFKIGESICRWTGWSLVAARPGKRINDALSPEENDNLPMTSSRISTLTDAEPLSLPRLRFGKIYRLRARVADLAGNGVALEEASDLTGATREIRFLRLEPAPAPAMAIRTAQKPGESMEYVVIRSNYGKTTEDFRQAYQLDEADPERHLLAPQSSQLMTEYHGAFDSMTPAGAYALITSREGTLQTVQGLPKVYPGATVAVPYLPEPLSRGASLSFTFNGKPLGSLELVDFYASGSTAWPDPRSMRLKVIESAGEDASVSRPADDLIVVSLPKAGVVKVRYSSYIDDAGAKLLGIAEWVAQKYPGKETIVQNNAKQGLHTMVTPSREITLVHAVQQPKSPPEVKKLVSEKLLAATYALLHGNATVHAPSTGTLEFRAEWKEPLDDIALPEWKTVDGSGHVGELSLRAGEEEVQFGNQSATPQVTGGTAFQRSSGFSLQEKNSEPSPTVFQRGQFNLLARPPLRHEFGDTKYRRVHYFGVAGTRYRENFLDLIDQEPPLDVPLTLEKEVPWVVDVLNSSRPPVPSVRYIVPTFQWETEEDDQNIIRRRCGGGLRVYLERPWYLSGEGERLGVIINPGGQMLDETVPEDDRRKPYVTQWGLDPISKSSGTLKPAPTLKDFQGASRTQTDVSLEEIPLEVGTANVGGIVPFHVAGYDVQFDKEKNLWFADIAVNPGPAYFPFIRMALVRYQPMSLKNCHCSRVVLTDFVQVVPDRVAAVTVEDSSIMVQVAGVYALRYGSSLASLVELNRSTFLTATLEQRTGPGDFSWIPVSSTNVFSSEGAPNPADRMIPTQIHGDKMRWVKEIKESVKKGSKDHRIVIREYEVHHDSQGNEVDRLVYADVIEI